MDALNVEQGIARIFELVGCVTSKPVIVGIYGHKHAGKTYLSKRCLEESLSRGLKAIGGRVELPQSYSSLSYPNPDVCFVDDYIIPLRNDSVKHVGKPIDITVLIRNYVICVAEDLRDIEWYIKQRYYDLIIDNPNSVRKFLLNE